MGRDRLETLVALTFSFTPISLLLAMGRDRLETALFNNCHPLLKLISYSLGDAIDWKLLLPVT